METKHQSLSELLEAIRSGIREALPDSYWVICEILELNENRSGHCYLDLVEKEEEGDALKARIRGTIWANRYRMLKPYFETSTGSSLKSGIKLLCRVKAEFHPLYGISLQVIDLDPAFTLGDLTRKKQEVIQRLRREGIFDMNRETDFPLVPQRIAIISSDSAAGYGDFMESLHGNPHGFTFITSLFPALMQGNEAPASIIAALERIHLHEEEFDCLVLIRGGGAKADMECFNDYELTAHLAQFPLPVITGIGHERDESVADLVAARMLKTPTAVAEFLVDSLLSFSFRLERIRGGLSTSVLGSLQEASAGINTLKARLKISGNNLLDRSEEFLHMRKDELRRNSMLLTDRAGQALQALEKRRELNDPVHILKKGFSITLSGGKTVRDINDIREGDLLETRLAGGSMSSQVKKVNKGKR